MRSNKIEIFNRIGKQISTITIYTWLEFEFNMRTLDRLGLKLRKRYCPECLVDRVILGVNYFNQIIYERGMELQRESAIKSGIFQYYGLYFHRNVPERHHPLMKFATCSSWTENIKVILKI
jgi:hypothetical protein